MDGQGRPMNYTPPPYCTWFYSFWWPSNIYDNARWATQTTLKRCIRGGKIALVVIFGTRRLCRFVTNPSREDESSTFFPHRWIGRWSSSMGFRKLSFIYTWTRRIPQVSVTALSAHHFRKKLAHHKLRPTVQRQAVCRADESLLTL